MTKYQHYVQTGIVAIPHISWGTHICYFFRGKKDLIDVSAPFIKSGLADNEKCILGTSDIFESNEALNELNKTIMGMDDYIQRGQLLIVEYDAWFTRQRNFDIDSILRRWIETERLVLHKGYSGLRAVGIMPYALNEYWDNVVYY